MLAGQSRVLLASLVAALALAYACADGDGTTVTDSPTPAATAAGFEARFAYRSCGVELPFGQDGDTVRCGTLTVLENRDRPQEGAIELAVAILDATGPDPAPDPIIYLAGGPGGPALEYDMQQFARDFARPLQRDRDIIFFDQRGVGRSEPALNCGEIDEGYFDDDAAYDAALVDCRERLTREGVDLDAYNSVQNAADIVDLAAALDYDAYNLYGVSYGTRLALTAMRDAPARIRSVVLDSSFPLQANLYADGAATLEESLQKLFDACAADAVCRAYAPDLRGTFFSVAERLDSRPVTVEAQDAFGESFDAEIDGDGFIRLIFEAMYSPEFIRGLPSGIVMIARGDTSPLSVLASYSEYADAGSSLGMHLSVQCSEEVPFNTTDAIRDARSPAFARFDAATLEEIESVRASCDAWGVEHAPAAENQPVISDIPTLLLVGQFDPITPPSYAHETQRTLARSYLFEFPGSGHGVLDYGCPMEIVAAFIDDPETPPDGGCIEDIPPLVFEEPEREP